MHRRSTTVTTIAAVALGLAVSAAPAAGQGFAPPSLGGGPPTSLPPVGGAQGSVPGPGAVAEALPDLPGDVPEQQDPQTGGGTQEPVKQEPQTGGSNPAKPATGKRKSARRTCVKAKRGARSKRKRSAARRCAKPKKRPARKRSTARAASLYGYFGYAACYAVNGGTLYQAPPAVSSSANQWIAHWNGFAYDAGGQWEQPREWIGPFYSHGAYPGWFFYDGRWAHQSSYGGFSQHGVGLVSMGAAATGVQYVYEYGTGEVASAYTSTSGCEGHGRWFTP
jgi:hypothetical protein